jgi:hypothetical protein
VRDQIRAAIQWRINEHLFGAISTAMLIANKV